MLPDKLHICVKIRCNFSCYEVLKAALFLKREGKKITAVAIKKELRRFLATYGEATHFQGYEFENDFHLDYNECLDVSLFLFKSKIISDSAYKELRFLYEELLKQQSNV